MGLIRSGNTGLTPENDDALTEYLWQIVREMIKTAIENKQNLIVEGCYIPFDWAKVFSDAQLLHMKYYCLILSERYIRSHYADIKVYASVIENRLKERTTLNHGDDSFLDGLPNDAQLLGIIDMCRDSTGHVDMHDVEALAYATGHDSFEDIGLIDAFAQQTNEAADREDSFTDDNMDGGKGDSGTKAAQHEAG